MDAPNAQDSTTTSAIRDDRLRWTDVALLLGLALVVLVPGTFRVSYTDRDEGWYAQVAREMRESGDWLVPRYLGEVWIAKPPLMYWLANASQWLFGIGEGQARLASVLSMAVSTVLVGTLGARMFGRRIGRFAGAIFITCGMTAVVGKMLLADGLMLALTLAAILMHWDMASRGVTHRRAVVYWIAIGLGVMAKGPATILFAGGFALALLGRRDHRGWIRDVRWWIWLPASVVVAGPWYAYIGLQAGDTLAGQFLWYESFARIFGTPHGHSSPPGMCLLVSLAGLLPWTPLVVVALVSVIQRREQEPIWPVLLIWLALPWLIVELMRGKLPHYVLPCYAPLAILTARAIIRMAEDNAYWKALPRGERVAWALAIGVMMMLGLGLIISGVIWRGEPWGPAVMITGAATASAFGQGIWLIRRKPLMMSAKGWVVCAVVFHVLAGVVLLPAFEPARLNRQVAAAVNELVEPDDEVWLCGFTEPTVHYYLNVVARDVHRHDLAEALSRVEGQLLLVISEKAVSRQEPALQEQLRPMLNLRRLDGINQANMDPVTIWIGRRDASVVHDVSDSQRNGRE